MSTFVLQESIKYFLENGNKIVFVCFLALSKAYDRVNHAILFMKLMELHTPTFIVKFVRNWYKEQARPICEMELVKISIFQNI